jgi:hypothetical protein
LLVVQNYVPDVHAGVVLMGGTLTSRPDADQRVLVQPLGVGTDANDVDRPRHAVGS